MDVDVKVGWAKLPHVDFGLSICGSSSGLNSCLQVLMHIPSFLRLMHDETHPRENCMSSDCLLCEFIQFHSQVITKSIDLSSVKVIHNLCLAAVIKSPTDLLMRIIFQLHCEWMESHDTKQSPISKIFSGLYQVESRCKCGFLSCEDKESMFISVGLRNLYTIQDALDMKFFGIEVTKWCSQCRESTEQRESFSVVTLPPVVLITVQRLSVVEDSSSFSSTLRLSRKAKFQFLGGALKDGNNHCTSVLRCPNSSLVLCNDSQVKKISYAALDEPKYSNEWCVLAYERISSLPRDEGSDASSLRSTSPGWIVSSFEQAGQSSQFLRTPSPIAHIERSKTPDSAKRILFQDDLTDAIDTAIQTSKKKDKKNTVKKPKKKKTKFTVEIEELERTVESENMVSVGCQTVFIKPKTEPPLSYEKFYFRESERRFQYFTGISKSQFDILFELLGGEDVLGSLKYEYGITTPKKKTKTAIHNKGRLFYVLMRLRRGGSLEELSCYFEVSIGLLSDIFYVFIRHMYLVFFSFKQEMFLTAKDQNFLKPRKFQPFKNLRAIIDTTSFRIQKPQDFQQQGNTYSKYKTGNVANVFIGISCRGAIMYISPGFEGSISDKQAVNLSDFMDYLEPGDQVMTDKGFDVKSELLAKGVELLKPPHLAGRPKLTPSEQLLTEAIATTRIYVEHAIGRIKQFALIRRVVPNTLLPIMDDIVYVCACLTNFFTPSNIKS